METLKFREVKKIKAYNVMELVVVTLFAVCTISKLLKIANDNTYRIKNNYLNWQMEKSDEIKKMVSNAE